MACHQTTGSTSWLAKQYVYRDLLSRDAERSVCRIDATREPMSLFAGSAPQR